MMAVVRHRIDGLEINGTQAAIRAGVRHRIDGLEICTFSGWRK